MSTTSRPSPGENSPLLTPGHRSDAENQSLLSVTSSHEADPDEPTQGVGKDPTRMSYLSDVVLGEGSAIAAQVSKREFDWSRF